MKLKASNVQPILVAFDSSAIDLAAIRKLDEDTRRVVESSGLPGASEMFDDDVTKATTAAMRILGLLAGVREKIG